MFFFCFFFLQIVVLARVIVDRDQVSLSAEGVTRLVMLLKSTDENTIILSGNMAFSALFCSGIPQKTKNADCGLVAGK